MEPKTMHDMSKYLNIPPTEEEFWSRTCSYGCRHCAGAIFFLGNPIDVPDEFECPHCKKLTKKR